MSCAYFITHSMSWKVVEAVTSDTQDHRCFKSSDQQLFTLFNCMDWKTRKYTIGLQLAVMQLVERLLRTPETRGSNPVIGKIYMYYQLY